MYQKAKDNLKEVIRNHVKANVKIYVILSVCFLIGLVSGAMAVVALSPDKKDELAEYLKGFLQLYDTQNIVGTDIFFADVWNNLKVIGIVWLLGAAVVGSPFICFVVMIRGFVTSFSTALIIMSVGGKGILFLIIGMLPSEIIMVTLIGVLSVTAIRFSMNILHKKNGASPERFSRRMINYCITTLSVFSGMVIASALFAWILPTALRVIM